MKLFLIIFYMEESSIQTSVYTFLGARNYSFKNIGFGIRLSDLNDLSLKPLCASVSSSEK